MVVACLVALGWMVMLGVWAGQTILLPAQPALVSSLPAPVEQAAPSVVTPPPAEEQPAVADRQEAAQEAAGAASGPETSFFALQIGAFSSEERAALFAREWQGRGLATFYQEPAGGGDRFWRVFAGRHENLAAANAEVARLLKEEKLKSFVALVQASEMRQP